MSGKGVATPCEMVAAQTLPDNLSRRTWRTNRSDARRGVRPIRASRTVRVFVGFTITAALISSLLIDHFGLFRMQPHPLNSGRIIGGLPLVDGINLITKF
jgi:Putative inner membrane exporter, YdcZ